MSLSQRLTLSEGETPMLPDLFSAVKDPLWLEGRQCSGHSFAVRATVLFIQREQNLSLGILGRHFSYYVLGIRAVLQNAKCFPLSNQQLQLWFNIVAVNINVGLYNTACLQPLVLNGSVIVKFYFDPILKYFNSYQTFYLILSFMALSWMFY